MDKSEIGKDLSVGQGTHEGMSGKHNEDSLGVFAWNLDGRQKFMLGVVADGVGGQTAGEVASRLAVSTIDTYFSRQDRISNVSGHMEQSILAANEAVYRHSQENPELRGMASTVAMVAILEGKLFTAHVGDSRIYLLRDGQLIQISIDHTWAQEAIEAGLLTKEQAKTHPNRNVIRRHLGGQLQVEVDHRLALEQGQSSQEALANQGTKIQPGDTFLICSDGLTDMIGDDSVYDSLQSHYRNLQACTQELIDKANRAGGKDNITVVLLQVPGGKAPAAVARPATKAAAAAVAPAAAAGPAAAASSGRGLLWLVLGGVFALVVLAGGAGLFFLLGDRLGGDSTPSPSDTPTVFIPEEMRETPGAPATAAILATAQSLEQAGEGTVSPEDTPALLPTLRSTETPTPVPVVIPTRTPTPVASNTPTSGGGPPPPTNTPKPSTSTPAPSTSTPAPSTSTPEPATNTPEPPTNTPKPTNTLEPTPSKTPGPPPTVTPPDE